MAQAHSKELTTMSSTQAFEITTKTKAISSCFLLGVAVYLWKRSFVVNIISVQKFTIPFTIPRLIIKNIELKPQSVRNRHTIDARKWSSEAKNVPF